MTMLLVALFLSQVALPSAPAAAGSAVLVIEDFDHPRLHRSRLEAEWGSVNEDRMRLEFSHDVRLGASGYALKVAYAARPGSPAGFWFSAAGPADDDRLTLDVSPFDELRFHTRGSGPDAAAYRLRIDLVGARTEAGGPAPAATWTEEIRG